jgi:hypothetical protein
MSASIAAQARTATNLLVALAMTLDSSKLLTDQQFAWSRNRSKFELARC